jgi:hypothetical protein
MTITMNMTINVTITTLLLWLYITTLLYECMTMTIWLLWLYDYMITYLVMAYDYVLQWGVWGYPDEIFRVFGGILMACCPKGVFRSIYDYDCRIIRIWLHDYNYMTIWLHMILVSDYDCMIVHNYSRRHSHLLHFSSHLLLHPFCSSSFPPPLCLFLFLLFS